MKSPKSPRSSRAFHLNGYGGTERIVSYLTEQLVRLGHNVTLFASGDSKTAAKLVRCSDRALRLVWPQRIPLPSTHAARSGTGCAGAPKSSTFCISMSTSLHCALFGLSPLVTVDDTA
jgi:hypothetical protein